MEPIDPVEPVLPWAGELEVVRIATRAGLAKVWP